MPEPARVFAFPTSRKSEEIIRTPEPVIAPAPVVAEAAPVEVIEEPITLEQPVIAEAIIVEAEVEAAPLTLEPPVVEPVLEIAAIDSDSDELVLGPQSMLDDPVMGNPLPPLAEEEPALETAAPRRRWLVSGDAEEEAPAARAPAAGATLFERMSNIARNAARGDVDTPEASDPLDIPRFLNRQNNQ